MGFTVNDATTAQQLSGLLGTTIPVGMKFIIVDGDLKGHLSNKSGKNDIKTEAREVITLPLTIPTIEIQMTEQICPRKSACTTTQFSVDPAKLEEAKKIILGQTEG